MTLLQDNLSRPHRERGLAQEKPLGMPGAVIAPLSRHDSREAARLFCETVHAINTRDYTPAQVDAWAPDDDAFIDAMADKLASQRGVGIRERGVLIGFGTLDEHGNIDMLYTHRDRQGQGVASRILLELESMAVASGNALICADVSLTARPFFAHRGYAVVRRQTVMRRGVGLVNFRMDKRLAEDGGFAAS